MNFRIVRHALVLAIPFLFAGCFKTREDIAREKEDQEVRSNLQQNIVEYNQGLDKLQSEVGRLHGRIDELEHQRKKELAGMSSARESDQKARDKTIDELRAKVASLQDAQNALFEEVKKLHEDGLAERAKPAPAPTPAKKKASVASTPR